MTLYKILKYLAVLVGVLGAIFFGRLLFVGEDAINSSVELQDSVIDPFLYLTYFILGLVILAVLIFVAMQLFASNVKATLISIGAFILIFIIRYVWADANAISYPNGLHISGTGAKWVDTGLKMFYILAVLAIISMLLSSFKKITFRN